MSKFLINSDDMNLALLLQDLQDLQGLSTCLFSAVGMWHHAFRKIQEEQDEQGYWNVAPSLNLKYPWDHPTDRTTFTSTTKISEKLHEVLHTATASWKRDVAARHHWRKSVKEYSLNPILFMNQMNQNLTVPKLKPFVTCHDPFNYTCPICSIWSIPG